MTPKPESETDPWKPILSRRKLIEATSGVPAVFDYCEEVDAARAAEAAQHRQEIAAKDETIGRWTQTGLTLMKFFAAVPAMNESDMPEFLWREVPTLIRSTRQAAAKAEARLAAAEAERDALERLRVHCERCGADYAATGVEAGCPCLVRAERDRLKAALERLRDCDWTIGRGDRMDAVRDIARAALTPQGQSTDGETR